MNSEGLLLKKLTELSKKWGVDIQMIDAGHGNQTVTEFFHDSNHLCPSYIMGEYKRQLDDVISPFTYDTRNNTAELLTTIPVKDKFGNEAELSVFHHNSSNGVFAVDSSFLSSTEQPVYDPFDGCALTGEDFETD
jgi:hypothetical protein